MNARTMETPSTTERTGERRPNGAAMAAFVAAGIGAFAVGLIVLLHEAGVITAPTLYGPSGAVSGRTTLAVVVWFLAWLVLHLAWRSRRVRPAPAVAATVVLTLLGILFTFPPLWGLF